MEEMVNDDHGESSSQVDDLFENGTEGTLPKFDQNDNHDHDENQINEPVSRQSLGTNNEYSAKSIENRNDSTAIQINPKNDKFNGFRFKFGSRYDPLIEEKFFPKFYQKFRNEGDFIIQRSGPHRSVCLICHCELLMNRSTHNIVNHLSGQRHLRKSSATQFVKCLRNYHDVFCNLDLNFQAHQIFFMPDEDLVYLKCVICSLYVKTHDVEAHIKNDPHKSYMMRLKTDSHAKNSFYLLDQLFDVYGIKHNSNVGKPPTNNNPQGPEIKNSPRNAGTNGIRRDIESKSHEIIDSVSNPKDPNPLKTLPRRFDSHLNYLENKGATIKCKACKKGENTVSKKDIQLHLIQPYHLVAAKLTLPDYAYFCEICDMKFHDEMTWQLHFNKGPNRHQTLAPGRRDKVAEHECVTCKVIIFGDQLSLRRHQKTFIRRLDRKKETILPDTVKTYFSSKNIIIDNGMKLMEIAQKIMANKESVHKCCQDMENALISRFPGCKTYPFGSRVSGLGSEDSDLDLFLDIGRMYDGVQKQDDENQFEIIKTCLELFRKTKVFYKITSRPTARTPIIRLKHRPTELDCDISFKHGLSVENTKFLRFCFELQPISQQLILLLKKWSHMCLLNENITTYAFAMMAIFYLQTEKYLVSVKTLKELNPQKNVVIDGWDTIAYTIPLEEIKKNVKICDEDIIEVLKGFFKYYSNFNYKTDVVCPLMGETILKSRFTDDLKGGKLPEEMTTYAKKINNDEHPEYFRALSTFCIQDPFDLSHNLTKACSQPLVEKFKKLCSLSYDMLAKLN